MTLRPPTLSPLTRRAFLGGTLGLGAAVLAACGSGDGDGDSGGADAQRSGSPARTADEQQLRVVALNTGQFETCLALGVLPVGVAFAESVGTASDGVPDFVKERFADTFDLDTVESVGTRQDIDIEKIATLEPDLVLSNKRADEDQLAELGRLADVALSNGGSEEWKADLATIGDALGKRGEADRLLADYEERAQDWATERGDGGTISLVRAKGDDYLMMGSRALASIVAADAGFTRPMNQAFDDSPGHDLSMENAADLDADWLFYGFPGAAAEVTGKSSWRSVPVVADGRAFEVDVDPWFLNASVVAADHVLTDMIDFIDG